MSDFQDANNRAVALDTKIMSDASKISFQYADLVSLATRQTMGSLDITVFSDAQGNVNASDVKIFMKNLGMNRFVFPFSVQHLVVNDDSHCYFLFIAA